MICCAQKEELLRTVGILGSVIYVHFQGHLRNVWWGGSFAKGAGGRSLVCREAREGGHVTSTESQDPHLTPVYNSSPGIWGTSNLGFLPTQKEKTFSLCCMALWPCIKASNEKNPGNVSHKIFRPVPGDQIQQVFDSWTGEDSEKGPGRQEEQYKKGNRVSVSR